MIEKKYPLRNRSIQEAEGFKELSKNLRFFMQFHNFFHYQELLIIHLMDVFYSNGLDLGGNSPKIKFEWPRDD